MAHCYTGGINSPQNNPCPEFHTEPYDRSHLAFVEDSLKSSTANHWVSSCCWYHIDCTLSANKQSSVTRPAACLAFLVSSVLISKLSNNFGGLFRIPTSPWGRGGTCIVHRSSESLESDGALPGEDPQIFTVEDCGQAATEFSCLFLLNGLVLLIWRVSLVCGLNRGLYKRDFGFLVRWQ